MKTKQDQIPANPKHGTMQKTSHAKPWHWPLLALMLSTCALHADDTMSTAIPIQPGEVSADISPVGDVDYYSFTITSPQIVTAATKASAVGVVPTYIFLFLYDSNGGRITNSTGQAPSFTIFLQPGTYYVKTYSRSDTTGTYRIVLKTQSSAIPLSEVTTGNLDVPNDWETYSFSLDTPGYVLLRARRPLISTPPIRISMIIWDEAGNRLHTSIGSDAGFEDVLNPGKYFVTVTSDYSGDYNLKLTTPETAPTIRAENTSGQIDLPRDHDYYQFVVPGDAPRAIRFRTSGTALVNLWLHDAFGKSVSYFGPQNTPGESHEVALTPGTYFLLIYGNEESGVGSYGNYTLTLSGIVPEAPEISIQQPLRRELADGKSTRTFGTAVAKAKKGITKNFVIRNAGNADLTGINLSIGGRNKRDYKITLAPASAVEPGMMTSFKITFLPKSKGKKSAKLRITSNDADENPFDIHIIGRALGK